MPLPTSPVGEAMPLPRGPVGEAMPLPRDPSGEAMPPHRTVPSDQTDTMMTEGAMLPGQEFGAGEALPQHSLGAAMTPNPSGPGEAVPRSATGNAPENMSREAYREEVHRLATEIVLTRAATRDMQDEVQFIRQENARMASMTARMDQVMNQARTSQGPPAGVAQAQSEGAPLREQAPPADARPTHERLREINEEQAHLLVNTPRDGANPLNEAEFALRYHALEVQRLSLQMGTHPQRIMAQVQGNSQPQTQSGSPGPARQSPSRPAPVAPTSGPNAIPLGGYPQVASPSTSRALHTTPPAKGRVDIALALTERAQTPTIVAPPLVRYGTIADPTLYHQSQLFQAAKATMGGDWIRETPWDLGQGNKHPSPDKLQFPGPWPGPSHDKTRMADHPALWLDNVCQWARMHQLEPSFALDLARTNLWTTLPPHQRQAYQDRVREETGPIPSEVTSAVVERFYSAVLNTAHAIDGTPYLLGHSQALSALHSATIQPHESINILVSRYCNIKMANTQL